MLEKWKPVVGYEKSYKEISEGFNVNQYAIKRIDLGQTWSALTGRERA